MDPLLWSVEDVVANLCHSEHLWPAKASSGDILGLESIIRENRIDGLTLLYGTSTTFLESKLGLERMRDIAAINFAIRELQHYSSNYRRDSTRAGSQKTLPSSAAVTASSPSTPSSPRGLVELSPSRSSKRDRPQPLLHEAPQPPNPKKRRIQISPQNNQPLFQRSCRPLAYLGAQATDLDAIFYGAVSAGQILRDEEQADNFSIEPAIVAPGQQLFINRCLKYFLGKAKEKALDVNRTAICPYPDRKVQPGKVPSFTLYSKCGGKVEVSKQNFLTYDNHNGPETPNLDSHDGPLVYLAKKWAGCDGTDTVLPIYGESDDESDSESWIAEVEAEEREQTSLKTSTLSRSRVEELVQQEIMHMKTRWETEKRLRLAANARKIWKMSRGRKGQDFVRTIQVGLETASLRLDKLAKEISDQLWTSEKAIRNQCQIMDTTVCSLMAGKWQLEVTALKTMPPEAPKAERVKNGKIPAKSNIDSEETIDSDTSFSDDSINGQSSNIEDVEYIDDIDDVAPALKLATTRTNQITPDLNGEVIDLTRDTSTMIRIEGQTQDDNSPMDTPPESASSSEIQGWVWSVLQQEKDSKKIILKLLYEMKMEDVECIETKIRDQGEEALEDEVSAYLKACSLNTLTEPSTKGSESYTIECVSRLWLCWHFARHKLWTQPLSDVGGFILNLEAIPNGFCHFYNFLLNITPLVDVQSESEHSSEEHILPTKNRKTVKQSIKGRQLRAEGQIRKAEAEERGKLRLYDLGSASFSRGDKFINVLKREDEDYIFIPEHISVLMKPHQLQGVQFLWREIVSPTIEDRQGCLLAHEMGLGKTMQTITFLITLSIAAASQNPRISKQVPGNLQRSQTVILCPAGLIGNWIQELEFWTPKGVSSLGEIYELLPEQTQSSRVALINGWSEAGGIIILGYEMFHRIVETPCYEHASRQLLNGATIVIADESHKIKNTKAGVNQSVSKFKTASRISITGSPLHNHLRDYFAMIDWVAPGYLGDYPEFKRKYQDPIQEGMYIDSTTQDKRRSSTVLKALTRDLEPKIHRASMNVLKDELPPKTEFVITLRLTKWQLNAYVAFIACLRQNRENPIQSQLFDWIRVMSLLLGHPSIFLDKLKTRQSGARASKTKRRGAGVANKPDPDFVSDMHIEAPASMVEQQDALIKALDIKEPSSVLHSFKTSLLQRIVYRSHRAGDQVLVFSHNLMSIDFIEQLLKESISGIRIKRLDGRTAMEDRRSISQQFNEARAWDVIVISTEAGGQGYNFHGANRVVLFDFAFNPQCEMQAIARSYRIGQQKPCFVYHLLIGCTYEECLHNTTMFKTQLAARVVDLKKPQRHSSKLKEYLFMPEMAQQDDSVASCMGKDKEVLDAILKEDPEREGICSVKTTDSIHAEVDEVLDEGQEAEASRMLEDERRRRNNPESYKKDKLLKAWNKVSSTNALSSRAQKRNHARPSTVQDHHSVQHQWPTHWTPSADSPSTGSPGVSSRIVDGRDQALPSHLSSGQQQATGGLWGDVGITPAQGGFSGGWLPAQHGPNV